MMRRVKDAGLALAMLLAITMTPAANAAVPKPVASAPAVKPAPARALVPAAFVVPTLIKAEGFKLEPLGPDKVTVDFDAYMSSIEHLQKTFSRSTGWPHKDISAADAMKDMEGEQARFRSRKSFAYAVLTPDGKRELGSVYVSPSPVDGYDAMVRMWVTKDQYDAGFDAKLYAWVVDWVRQDWPFTKVAYPGRAIDWAAWDLMVAASKAKNAT
jgi:hypothetical protein